jgi:uncharacterized protein involved in response to NO
MPINMKIHEILTKAASEPFRIFFLFGTAMAWIAVFFWPAKFFEIAFINTSTKVHVYLQIYGFLFAFILGFLTTAIPRFTQTNTLSITELFLLVILYVSLVTSLFCHSFLFAHLFFVLNLLLLICILVPRVFKRKRNPPPTFIFLPFGFLLGLSGSCIQLCTALNIATIPARLADLSNLFLFQGFMLLLLIGVGGFLIRSILGWGQNLPETQTDQIKLPTLSKPLLIFHGIIAAGIVLSFIVEVYWHYRFGYALRASLVTLILLLQIKIYKKPISGKLSAYTLFFALWLLALGLWGMVFISREYRLAFLHLCFAGGFAISTFSVATRVILSHCNHGHLLKTRYLPFGFAMAFLYAGLATRFYAEFNADHYFNHMAYAGIIWLVGIFIWSFFILWKSITDTFTNNLP